MKEDKLKKLRDILLDMGRVVVAYSGGVDSTFLLRISRDTLGKENVLAVIAVSPTYPSWEWKEAVRRCEEMDVDYQVIHTEEWKDENFLSNPPERCYYCKKELFHKLKRIAEEQGDFRVVEASNVDDLKDFRPGMKAKEEMGVRSPLIEAGFTKKEIREYSRQLSLPTWNKPSFACLSSRIPYGERITREKVERIEKGEKFLKDIGFPQVRVRVHGEIARIEVEREYLERLLKERERVVNFFRALGFIYVTLDLEGYRSGSMNLLLSQK